MSYIFFYTSSVLIRLIRTMRLKSLIWIKKIVMRVSFTRVTFVIKSLNINLLFVVTKNVLIVLRLDTFFSHTRFKLRNISFYVERFFLMVIELLLNHKQYIIFFCNINWWLLRLDWMLTNIFKNNKDIKEKQWISQTILDIRLLRWIQKPIVCNNSLREIDKHLSSKYF